MPPGLAGDWDTAARSDSHKIPVKDLSALTDCYDGELLQVPIPTIVISQQPPAHMRRRKSESILSRSSKLMIPETAQPRRRYSEGTLNLGPIRTLLEEPRIQEEEEAEQEEWYRKMRLLSIQAGVKLEALQNSVDVARGSRHSSRRSSRRPSRQVSDDEGEAAALAAVMRQMGAETDAFLHEHSGRRPSKVHVPGALQKLDRPTYTPSQSPAVTASTRTPTPPVTTTSRPARPAITRPQAPLRAPPRLPGQALSDEPQVSKTPSRADVPRDLGWRKWQGIIPLHAQGEKQTSRSHKVARIVLSNIGLRHYAPTKWLP